MYKDFRQLLNAHGARRIGLLSERYYTQDGQRLRSEGGLAERHHEPESIVVRLIRLAFSSRGTRDVGDGTLLQRLWLRVLLMLQGVQHALCFEYASKESKAYGENLPMPDGWLSSRIWCVERTGSAR